MIELLAALAFALAVTFGPAAYRARTAADTGLAAEEEIPAAADSGDGAREGVIGAASMTGEPGGCGCQTGADPSGLTLGALALAAALRRRAR